MMTTKRDFLMGVAATSAALVTPVTAKHVEEPMPEARSSIPLLQVRVDENFDIDPIPLSGWSRITHDGQLTNVLQYGDIEVIVVMVNAEDLDITIIVAQALGDVSVYHISPSESDWTWIDDVGNEGVMERVLNRELPKLIG